VRTFPPFFVKIQIQRLKLMPTNSNNQADQRKDNQSFGTTTFVRKNILNRIAPSTIFSFKCILSFLHLQITFPTITVRDPTQHMIKASEMSILAKFVQTKSIRKVLDGFDDLVQLQQ
jgi:hypothetical protein